MDTLTGRGKDLITLAAAPFKYSAARERQARDDFELSGTRFWQEVNHIIDMPAAHAWNPHALAQLKDPRRTPTRRLPVRRLI